MMPRILAFAGSTRRPLGSSAPRLLPHQEQPSGPELERLPGQRPVGEQKG